MVVKMWRCVALYKHLRYQWFNLWVLLEATSTTRLTFPMCHGCVYTGSFVLACTWLLRTLLAARRVHRTHTNRLFTVLYFTIRSSRSSALRFGLHLACVSKLLWGRGRFGRKQEKYFSRPSLPLPPPPPSYNPRRPPPRYIWKSTYPWR